MEMDSTWGLSEFGCCTVLVAHSRRMVPRAVKGPSTNGTMKELYRNRCLRCMAKGSRKVDVPDLTILYARDGEEWERYLDQCFRQLIPQGGDERPLHIHTECLERLSFPLSSTKVSFLKRSKAQLVILTPEFLDFVHTHPGTLVGQVLEPHRVVAMLCGVERQDVDGTHRAELISFQQWQHVIPVRDQDKDFVLQLFHRTVEVMELAEDGGRNCQKPQFKLTPRKVRESYNKVFVLLQNPVALDQDIKVFVTGQKRLAKEVTSKIRNPYIVQFVLPDQMLTASQIVSVQVMCDGLSLGTRQLKCESPMGELNQLLQNVNNPMAYLSQTLGLSGSRMKDLDNYLVKVFRKNLPPRGFNLLDCSNEVLPRRSEDEIPTLLHFAAHYGLRELCSCLLDLPLAKIACNLRNMEGHTPADLADLAGHKDLAQMIENFMNLAVTADLYAIITTVKEHKSDNNQIYNALYDYPSSVPLYDSPFPIPIPVQVEEDDSSSETYLPMHCCNPAIATLLEPHQRLVLGLESVATECDVKQRPESIKSSQESVCIRNDNLPAHCHGYNQSQTELLEILEDFKNGKYSINEVEHLFEEWKTRQSLNSFKEKEAELRSLRSKYDQIQERATEKGKKALSLDKIVSLLTHKNLKNKSSTKNKLVTQPQKTCSENFYNELKHNRPVSVLSTASTTSSSSSDRLSTLSNASTYDSGAQSDSGEDVIRIKKRMSAAIRERISQFEFSANPPPVPFGNEGRDGETAAVNQIETPLIPSRTQGVKQLLNSESFKPIPPPRPDSLSPDYVSPDPEIVYQIPSSTIRKVTQDSVETIDKTKVESSPTPKNYESPVYVNVVYNNGDGMQTQFAMTTTQSSDYYNVPPPSNRKKLTILPSPLPSPQGKDSSSILLDPYPHKKPLGVLTYAAGCTLAGDSERRSSIPFEYHLVPPKVPARPSHMKDRPLPAIPK